MTISTWITWHANAGTGTGHPSAALLFLVILYEAIVNGLMAAAITWMSNDFEVSLLMAKVGSGMFLVKSLGHLRARQDEVRRALNLPPQSGGDD